MTTAKITIDEGTTTNTATNTISEDAVTKHIPRSVLNTSAGVEISIATSTLQTTGNTSLGNIDTNVALLTTQSDFDTKTGSLTEAAPASDTASSGVNGRLQRIAQRLTSMITALGSPFQAGGSIGNTAFGSTQSGTWTVQPGNTPNSTPWLVTDTAGTSGGLTMSKTISAASTNATSVKGSAGQLYSVQVFNTNAAARYLKLFNKATAPTVGSDTPVKVFTIPGNASGSGVVINWDKGLAFGTGIAFALTTGAPDSDTGSVALNEIVVNLDYK